MNKLRTIFLMLLCAGSISLMATNPNDGKEVKEGKVSYKVDAANMDPSMASFFENMTMVLFFNTDNIRMEMNMGMMGTNTTISNGKSGETLTLMDMMGNKLAVNGSLTEEQIEWTVENTSETKTIAGYECKKSILKSDQVNLTYYVTDRITTPKVKSDMPFDKLEGFPLQIEVNNAGVSFNMVASKVTDVAVDAAKFNMNIPEGYTLMTQEEMMKMLGGMMGQ